MTIGDIQRMIWGSTIVWAMTLLVFLVFGGTWVGVFALVATVLHGINMWLYVRLRRLRAYLDSERGKRNAAPWN